MTDNVDEVPAWQAAMRRAYLGYLQIRYRDPIQRQAQAQRYQFEKWQRKADRHHCVVPGVGKKEAPRTNSTYRFRC